MAEEKLGNFKNAVINNDKAQDVNDANSQACYFRTNAKHDLKDIGVVSLDYQNRLHQPLRYKDFKKAEQLKSTGVSAYY